MFLNVWRVYFGPVGINLNIILFGFLVLLVAIFRRLRGKKTSLFEVSFLLFLVGFLYSTFHDRLLQYIFPVSLPEKPLLDNNLTFNYTLTGLLTFLVFPVLLLIVLKSDVSFETVGLKVSDFKKTASYALLGSFFSGFVLLLFHASFGFRWISEYSFAGLVLWVLLVTILSVFLQIFFFTGVLFHKYLNHENGFLLAAISILAFQLFISALDLCKHFCFSCESCGCLENSQHLWSCANGCYFKSDGYSRSDSIGLAWI